MMDRADRLFARLASLDEARHGAYYNLLPYIEYSLAVDLPAAYLDAISGRIRDLAETDGYQDAGHYFVHALGGSPEITAQIPTQIVRRYVDRLLREPDADGGWPASYDDAWRVWTTAENLATLARLRT